LRGALRAWSSRISNLKSNIDNVSTTIQRLDIIEEYRYLSLEEWNFRSILKEKMFSLLKQQRTYWRQRGNIKWVTLGDAGTKFFHANATIRHWNNLITKIKDEADNFKTEHGDKELIIWRPLNKDWGQTESRDILFDVPSLSSVFIIYSIKVSRPLVTVSTTVITVLHSVDGTIPSLLYT